MTGGSQSRVGRISSRDNTASAQVEVLDTPDPPLFADDAVSLGLLEVERVILLAVDLLACAVDAADYTLRVSNLFARKLFQIAFIVELWLWLVTLLFGGR